MQNISSCWDGLYEKYTLQLKKKKIQNKVQNFASKDCCPNKATKIGIQFVPVKKQLFKSQITYIQQQLCPDSSFQII